MQHQKRASQLQGEEASLALYKASLYFSIAAYPHIRGDNLASQAQVLANKAYEEASKKVSTPLSNLKSRIKVRVLRLTCIYHTQIGRYRWLSYVAG